MSYELDSATGVLRRAAFPGISYSDGDEIETRLLSVVSTARDVSLFSPELRAACVDWPALYHLSAARANLLRPIADRLTGDVLELGAGCGAITRFLGENGANVLAIEGSPRRAAIARARTRDLGNVTIAVDDIGQCPVERQFDAITLIGVLEYAALFGDSGNPACALLERCRAWLKPGGMLVVAIENQLGLKYWAGAPEDHVGIPYYGLEDRYAAKGPRTYGRHELANLLNAAGLPVQRWYAPFPDYKLPSAVLSEVGLMHPVFDGAALAGQTASSDPQLPPSLAFQPEPVWSVAFQNRLGLELSNSFLLVAGLHESALPPAEGLALGWHFNTGRAAAYCKETRFESNATGGVRVVCERLAPQASEPLEAAEGPLVFDLLPVAEYAPGSLLADDFQALISQDGWGLDDVAAFFRRYLDAVGEIAAERNLPPLPISLEGPVDGRCFDWVPQNLIQTPSGAIRLIDEEWRYRSTMTLGFLLFRAIRASLTSGTTVGINATAHSLSVRQFIAEVLYRVMGAPSGDEAIEQWMDAEVCIQQQVHGGLFDENGFRAWFDTPLSHLSRRLATQNQVLREQVSGLEQSLDLVLRSRAWVLTRPLRRLHDWVRARRSRGGAARSANALAPTSLQDSLIVDIVICVHNAFADVQQCLDSILRNTPPPWRLILVDDGSDQPTADLLRAFAERQGDRTVLIRHNRAQGYTLAANAGLKASAARRVVLLNSDTIVTPGWLCRLLACAESAKDIGLVGPLSNCASWQSVPTVFAKQAEEWSVNPPPEGWSFDFYSAKIAERAIPIWPRVGFLNGFCLLIKRELIEAIGIFDETSFGRGYGEENDYCLRAAAAGWSLAVADDCFIQHAQSKSYSDTRRAELVPDADAALHRKHGGDGQIANPLIATQYHPALAWVRARVAGLKTLHERCRQVQALGRGWRVLFVLPVSSIGGGGNIVVLEAERLRKLGVDVRLANIAPNRARFEACYQDLQVPVHYLPHIEDFARLAREFDVVVATLYTTVDWLKPVANHPQAPVIAYYVQDYEPAFFAPDDPEHARAKASYTAIANMQILTKTAWTRDRLSAELGVDAAVIGPSYDDRRFHPAPEWSTQAPVTVVAMVRPSTPRRNPEVTMRVLKALAARAGEAVRIVIFGVAADDPALAALERDFPHENRGELGVAEVAELLREADVFLDASHFQAMGLTAMEAMASGTVVVGPLEGGLGEVVKDGANGRLVDTRREDAILAALLELVEDATQRRRLSLEAVQVVAYSPEQSALRLLECVIRAAKRL